MKQILAGDSSTGGRTNKSLKRNEHISMKYNFEKLIVIALGGSIVCPDKIDILFLRKFKKFIEDFIGRGYKFILVIGGGGLGRVYQEAATKVADINNEDKDWIGIHATRLNAHLLRTIFKDLAEPVLIDSLDKVKSPKKPVSIASGWRPGWSTDYVALAIAEILEIKEVIIAGKPAFVCDRDPSKYKKVKKFEKMSWTEYRKLIPDKWVPGSHSPVDPIGARLADEKNIKAIIINGKDLKNFDRLLIGKEFQGTIIG